MDLRHGFTPQVLEMIVIRYENKPLGILHLLKFRTDFSFEIHVKWVSSHRDDFRGDLTATSSNRTTLCALVYKVILIFYTGKEILFEILKKKMNFGNFGDKLSKDDLPMSKVKIGLAFFGNIWKQSWQVYLARLGLSFSRISIRMIWLV